MASMRSWSTELASIEDYRQVARRRLPRVLFDYIDGGSYAEVTLQRNVADLCDIGLRQRVLHDVSSLKTNVQILGQEMAMPVVLAPVGMAGMFARRGEVSAADAAKAAGLPFCLSTLSICGVEEVSREVTPPWFQLYMIKDRGYMAALLARAREAGCPVLVFTVDLPTPGARYRDVRSGLFGSASPLAGLKRGWDGASHPEWLWDVWVQGRPHSFGNIAGAIPGAKGVADFWVWVKANFDPALTWRDFDWIRQNWAGPIVIKGVLDAEDAHIAAKTGFEGLIVSNHGGRQLDGALSSARALPRIMDAAGGDLMVMMDGGVRSGLDVLKALAMGAKAVMIGRAWAYALGARGEAGVAAMLKTLREELLTAMALTGCLDLNNAGRHLLAE